MYQSHDRTDKQNRVIVNNRALIVFAKVPEAGKVKTRLSPPLSADDAAKLYESFLLDALEVYNAMDVDVVLYLGAESRGRKNYPEFERARFQEGATLGERMSNAFRDMFDGGYRRVCIIGTDHPTLGLEKIEEGFSSLEHSTAVIGPSADGGYYLLGMNTYQPELFDGMTYSHPSVFAETIERARQSRIGIAVLDEWYDVDDEASLRRMMADLDATKNGLHRTRAVVRYLRKSYSSFSNS